MRTFFLALLCVAPLGAATPEEIFRTRIMPIFKSPQPSSCVQCHLAGIDLKNYILPSARDTFVSLRDQGLVDLEQPEKSKILALIQMGEGSKNVLHEKTRQAELEAFRTWLKAAVADPELRSAPKLPADKVPAQLPNAVIRHARKDRLLASYENTIWAMRFRCMNCHQEGSAPNKKHAEQWGDQVAWFKSTPESSLDYLLRSKLINTKEPEKSLLLQKPLNLVKHEGGKKFELGDLGYKAYRQFIDDYVKTLRGEYQSASALPPASPMLSFGTDRWLKLANTPDAWGDKIVMVQVFAKDLTTGQYETPPVASTDRRVWGKGNLWQHNLTLHAAVGSARATAFRKAATLPQGTYLVKVFVDADGKLEKDWSATLTEKDYVGQCEVTTTWREGYGAMTVVEATKVKR